MAVRKAELVDEVGRLRRRFRVPGVAAGLISGDRELVATSGVTSVDTALPVDDQTLFMIGSTTKTFTATALMRLVEQGRVSLDDPVTKHLPRFRLKDLRATRALTLHHLVTHTGGWDGDISLDTGWGDDALARYVDALRDRPQQVPVGAVWAYNNSGFSVAGRVIEVVTGTTYERAIHDLLFAPLGMDNSYFTPVDAATRRFAVGHLSVNGGRASIVHAWGLPRAGAPAGGILSSVRDQLTWARFHLGDGRAPSGRRVLRAATMRLMQREHAAAGTLADAVGISWLLRDRAGVRTVAHGGNVSNLQLSSFLMVPERRFALTVLTNATRGADVHRELERWALDRVLGIRDQVPAPIATPDDVTAYTGTYASHLFELVAAPRRTGIALTQRWNLDPEEAPEEDREHLRKLVAQSADAVELAFYAPDRVVIRTGPRKGTRGEFIRLRPGGPVAFLRWGGRLLARQ